MRLPPCRASRPAPMRAIVNEYEQTDDGLQPDRDTIYFRTQVEVANVASPPAEAGDADAPMKAFLADISSAPLISRPNFISRVSKSRAAALKRTCVKASVATYNARR